MRPFDALLLDLDGTLLDTLGDLAVAMNQALAEERLPTHPVDRYRYFVGDGAATLAARAAGNADEATVRRLIDGFRRAYAACWNRETRVYPGILELLAGAMRNNLRLTVFSNKPNEFTQPLVKAFFPDVPFAAVRGATADMPKKPDPAGALAVAHAAGASPERVLYLGDTDTDMICAGRAGMFAAGVAWGFRPVEELRAAGARRIFARPEDVLQFLESGEAE